ncbi:hypothetical protein CYMTET_31903, partial [Cymbomonas tetramitiformis]
EEAREGGEDGGGEDGGGEDGGGGGVETTAQARSNITTGASVSVARSAVEQLRDETSRRVDHKHAPHKKGPEVGRGGQNGTAVSTIIEAVTVDKEKAEKDEAVKKLCLSAGATKNTMLIRQCRRLGHSTNSKLYIAQAVTEAGGLGAGRGHQIDLEKQAEDFAFRERLIAASLEEDAKEMAEKEKRAVVEKKKNMLKNLGKREQMELAVERKKLEREREKLALERSQLQSEVRGERLGKERAPSESEAQANATNTTKAEEAALEPPVPEECNEFCQKIIAMSEAGQKLSKSKKATKVIDPVTTLFKQYKTESETEWKERKRTVWAGTSEAKEMSRYPPAGNTVDRSRAASDLMMKDMVGLEEELERGMHGFGGERK